MEREKIDTNIMIQTIVEGEWGGEKIYACVSYDLKYKNFFKNY